MVGMPDPNEFSPARWPVVRQMQNLDAFGLSDSAVSARTESMAARTAKADRLVASVCPYCAVGCGQVVYVKDEKIIDIEGDPDSPDLARLPLPEGRRHVPAGHRLASRAQRPLSPARTARNGRPSRSSGHGHGRRAREEDARGHLGRRRPKRAIRCAARMGIAHLGGATLDNEENYLIKKLFTALGHRPDRKPGPYLTLRHGPQFGDLLRTRRRHHVPAGSAERGLHRHRRLQHGRVPPGRLPVGDGGQASAAPRSSMWIRASRAPAPWPTSTCRSAPGSDIAFLGGIIRYIIENERYFHDYVVQLHERPGDHRRGFPRHRRPRRPLQRLGRRERPVRHRLLELRGRRADAAAGEREQFTGEPQLRTRRRSRTSRRTRRCSIRAACSRS